MNWTVFYANICSKSTSYSSLAPTHWWLYARGEVAKLKERFFASTFLGGFSFFPIHVGEYAVIMWSFLHSHFEVS